MRILPKNPSFFFFSKGDKPNVKEDSDECFG